MATMRTRRETGVIPFDSSDRFGRRSIEGSNALLTNRRVKAWSKARNQFYHRVKNGIRDPFTFFHLVEELADIRTGHPFTAAELAEHLNRHRPVFTWDPVTVGRILNDLVESWQEANPGVRFQPLVSIRRWSGREYMTQDFPESRAVLMDLLDDLVILGDKTGASRQQGPALDSPLTRCPSVTLRLGTAQ